MYNYPNETDNKKEKIDCQTFVGLKAKPTMEFTNLTLHIETGSRVLSILIFLKIYEGVISNKTQLNLPSSYQKAPKDEKKVKKSFKL